MGLVCTAQHPSSAQGPNCTVIDLGILAGGTSSMGFGINSLGDLIQKSENELLEAKNFGQTSLGEVREKLAQYGLALRGH